MLYPGSQHFTPNPASDTNLYLIPSGLCHFFIVYIIHPCLTVCGARKLFKTYSGVWTPARSTFNWLVDFLEMNIRDNR